MGYFSNLDIATALYDHDRSYTPPEMQLLWRLEDLQAQLEALSLQRSAYENRSALSDADLRYVLPEHFLSVSDVRKAIELAIEDLKNRYGIHVQPQEAEEMPAVDEISGMQISFLDLLAACPLCAA